MSTPDEHFMLERSFESTLPEGYKLYVRGWGKPGQPILVLLHGLASTSHMFDLIAPMLAVDYHVIAFDQRGHGLSDKPDTGYDFATNAADLDSVLAQMGYAHSQIVLGGHSWGAAVALYYAATRPQQVAKLMLIDGGLRRLRDRYPTWPEAEKSMAPPRISGINLETLRQRIRTLWLKDMYRPELEPLALAIYDLSDTQNIRARLSFDNHMQIAHALWSFNAADYYPLVQCPVIAFIAVAPGTDPQPDMQRYAENAEKLLRQVKIVWMNNTVHDIPWHRPRELADSVQDFLQMPG